MEVTDLVKESTATDLGALMDAGDDAVVTLVAGDTRLVAHRAVLAARSPVLATKLCDDSLEVSSGEVPVPDVEAPVLRQLLSHLYTLQVPQLPSMAPHLLAAADIYGASILKAWCERQVAAQLTVETAAATAVLAVRYSSDRLKRAAFSFIKAHTHEVMASRGWAEAVHMRPDDVVEVCQLLSETTPETSSSCVSESSTTEPVGEVWGIATTDLADLLDAGDGAMVTLVAGETRLVAHRAVLAARSPVFAAKFRYDTQEGGGGQLEIPDVEGPVLRQLLSHLYTLQVPQLPGMAPQLLAAADIYGASVLKAECERQVAAQLSVETAAATAVLAVRHSSDILRQAAANFIRVHTLEVIASQGWAHAVRTQPEDVVEVSRLLLELPGETSATAAADDGSTSGRGHTSASAASLVPSSITPSAEVDVAISRMLIHSVLSQVATGSGTPATTQPVVHSHTAASDASPVAAKTSPTPDDAAEPCACARASAGSRGTADTTTTQPHLVHDQAPASTEPLMAAKTAPTPEEDVHISRMLMQSILAQTSVEGATSVTTPLNSGHSNNDQISATAARMSPVLDDAAVSRILMCSVIAQASADSGTSPTTEPHADSSEDSPTPDSACPRTTAQPTPASDVPGITWNISEEGKGRRLIEAAKKGLVEEVRELLAAGADVRATDRSLTMWTALHWAADRGHLDVVQCLLEAGAEVDARNRLLQNTPLHYAAWHGHVPVVRQLLASSADPNARSVDGRTPLHFAAYNDRAETVTVLLEAGADKWAKSVDGHTPLDLAREYGRLQAIALLK